MLFFGYHFFGYVYIQQNKRIFFKIKVKRILTFLHASHADWRTEFQGLTDAMFVLGPDSQIVVFVGLNAFEFALGHARGQIGQHFPGCIARFTLFENVGGNRGACRYI